MLEPLSAESFTREHAAHLLNRAGFGGTPGQVEGLFEIGLSRAVDAILNYETVPENYPPPAWSTIDPAEADRIRAIKFLPLDQKKEAQQEVRKTYRREDLELHQWWLERMRSTGRPLQEKMTLFWHSLFATSIVKVQNPILMWRQNETFRNLAIGNWSEILIAMAKDPAMLVWLDGANSQKGKPNENFAREVMELFTLGEGHYTENDIKQSAKALVGWRADRVTGEFIDEGPRRHDYSVKTYLGQTGPFVGEDIMRILANEPRSGQYVCERLWRYFASEEPNPEVTSAMASTFRSAGLDFKPLLRSLFMSKAFYAPEVVRQQVKSPVQWLVSTCRYLERTLPPPIVSYQMMKTLGQVVFAPPSVKGWDTGVSWISTNTLLDRYNFAALLVQGQPLGIGNLQGILKKQQQDMADSAIIAAPIQLESVEVHRLFTPADLATPDTLLTAIQNRLIQGGLSESRRASLHQYLEQNRDAQDDKVKGAIRLLMSTPDFQLT